jgi:hypothetical protein
MGIPDGASADGFTGLQWWIATVRNGLIDTDAKYPFIAYGTDWLAFAHLVIALAFWGPWRDPVRNVWIIDWGIWACILVVPLALVCGPLRGIPPGWRFIDCLFGIVGIGPLLIIRHDIRELEKFDVRFRHRHGEPVNR